MVPIRLNHYLDGSEYVTNVLIEGVDVSGDAFFYTKINYGNSRGCVPMATSEFCQRLDEDPVEHVRITSFSLDKSLLPTNQSPQDLIRSLGFDTNVDGLRLNGLAVQDVHRQAGLVEMSDLLTDRPQVFLDDGLPSKRSFVLLSNRLGFKIKPMIQFSAAALLLRDLPSLEHELALLKRSIFLLWKDAGLFYKTGDFARLDGYRREFSKFVLHVGDFQKAQSNAVLELMKK